jgi:hypothetical protein
MRLVVGGGDDRDAVAVGFLADLRLVVRVEPCAAEFHLAAGLGQLAKPGPPADAIARLEDDDAVAALAEVARGDQAGEPGADDDDVDWVLHRCSSVVAADAAC